jgi:hypothetical protein
MFKGLVLFSIVGLLSASVSFADHWDHHDHDHDGGDGLAALSASTVALWLSTTTADAADNGDELQKTEMIGVVKNDAADFIQSEGAQKSAALSAVFNMLENDMAPSAIAGVSQQDLDMALAVQIVKQ